MLRRQLISIVIGAIAAFAGLTTIVWLRQDRCRQSGGAWDAAARLCSSATGRLSVERPVDLVAGVIVGLVLAFMLYRVSTFSRRVRRT